jgi:hypothetical protein
MLILGGTMTADSDGVAMALLIESGDAGLADDLTALFPAEDVSTSDNFVGGAEIAVFFTFAKDVLAKILGFVGHNRDRVKTAKLTIGRESVSLQGYSAEDIEKLLGSPGFQAAMKSVKQG